MANPTITIPLDSQTAQVYNSASAEEKRKMKTLLGLWLRELVRGEQRSLQQILDATGRKAQARGLTPEMLESLVEGEGEKGNTTLASGRPGYLEDETQEVKGRQRKPAIGDPGVGMFFDDQSLPPANNTLSLASLN